MRGYWEHFEHEADIGVRGFGSTLDEAFAQAAMALTAVITPPENVLEQASVRISCQAPDPELLLADWLNALIYEMATRRMLFSRYLISIQGDSLQATAWGETLSRDRHGPAVEVKGATYTELYVAQQADGLWLAQCVVDV